MRRKGELSKGRIDRERPHQVALPASFVNGKNYMILHRFCRGLSVCDHTKASGAMMRSGSATASRSATMPNTSTCISQTGSS